MTEGKDSTPLPPWGEVIRALVDALRTHRGDMHETSDRPCSTCAKSAAALALYERRAERDQARRVS